MSRKHKLKAGLASILATLGGAAALGMLSVGSAGATATPPDPQTTNVPYLAWAGEQIRMVKCFEAPSVDATSGPKFNFSAVRAEFLVEDWSGDPNFKPQIEDPTVKLFFSRTRDQVCAQGDAIALDPGMARIELDVTDSAGVLGLPSGGGPADPMLKHQFLAGWMTLNDPSLKELAASDFAEHGEDRSYERARRSCRRRAFHPRHQARHPVGEGHRLDPDERRLGVAGRQVERDAARRLGDAG